MTTKTFRLSGKRMERAWHVLDAGGRPLGRVANDAARLLLGKHKPTYEPHLPMGDFVVIVNARDVVVTGTKAKDKLYYRHSGYPGGLRSRTFEEEMARDPRRVIERAVKGMLPHNARGRELFRHLKVYPGPQHPHEAQVNAGTGARAKKSAAQAEREQTASRAEREARPAMAAAEQPAPTEPAAPAAAAPAPAGASEAEARLSGALSRYKREELDAEATRLGIEIDPDWNKPDVVAAIEAHYEANPLQPASGEADGVAEDEE